MLYLTGFGGMSFGKINPRQNLVGVFYDKVIFGECESKWFGHDYGVKHGCLWAYVGSDIKSGAASFQIRHSKKRGTLRQSIDPLFHWTKRPVSTTPPRTPAVAPTNKMVETTRLILG